MMKRIFTHKPTLANCKIYQMLRRQAKAEHISFHTPGHKTQGFDITELSYSDNLACPTGCIAEAEQDIARLTGAAASFILTDGSTAGVYAMLYAAKATGVKTLAVPQTAHKSVFCGCEILGITPLTFHVEQVFCETVKKADGVLITSPDYYGRIPDLKSLRDYCEAEHKLFLIDGAHGGHLRFEKALYAGAFAHLWVDGVHKSLPALTQGAVVSAKTPSLAALLFKGVNAFRTTSPSYPIMASVEYAVKYPRNPSLEEAVRRFAATTPRVILHEDWTKLCVRFGKNADVAQTDLEKRGVFSEFCDGDYIVFYLSPATKFAHFKRLCKTLTLLLEKYPYIENERIPAPLVLQKTGEVEWVDLPLSLGKICAEDCGLFPPCTPLLIRGEVITQEKLSLLQSAKKKFGLWQGKIAVFKTQNDA